ncbi:MAG: cytochrome c-type biogenesis protein CcmH [Gemmatimonadota bacterium]
MTRRSRVLLTLLAWVAVASPALAQAPEAQVARPNPDVADRAIGRIRSPYCPGLMLEVCPSPQAAVLRDSIGARAARGEPADSIVEAVLAQIGEEYRAYPKSRGQGLLAWIIPPFALLSGLLIVALVLRHLRDRNPEQLPELDEEEERRVQEALAQLEKAERDTFEVY